MSATILQSAPSCAARSRAPRSVIAGRIITGIALAFMTFDVGVKLSGAKEAIVAIFLWGGLYLRDPRVRAALGPTR
jgi:hypothetical protein